MIKAQVIGWKDYKRLSEHCGIEIRGDNPDSDITELCEGDQYLAVYQLSQALMENPLDVYQKTTRPGNYHMYKHFCNSYEQFKLAEGLFDFNDMLSRALDAPPPPIDVLFADEAQDYSPLQWKVIEYWTQHVKYTQVAGDDDQAIYVWGGADAHGMDTWCTKHGADVKVLEQSHRIPRTVHRVAESLIDNVDRRVAKVYQPRDEEGVFRRIGHVDHLDRYMACLHGDDIMFIYRNHSLRKDFVEFLMQRGVPFTIDNGKPGPLQGYPAQAARSWKKLLSGGTLTEKEKNTLSRQMTPVWSRKLAMGQIGVSSRNVGFRAVLNIDQHTRDYLYRIDQTFGLDVKPTIHLTSIHGSKGRQADTVVLLNSMNTRTLESYLHSPDDEIRTFYVGLTRAKHGCYVVDGEDGLQELR